MTAVPMDQASDLRALFSAQPDCGTASADPPRTARVVAVASGKGGVGKTNVSVNLAIRLAALGYRVVLIDADLGTANVDVLLNLQPPFNLSHVIRRQKTMDEIVVPVDRGLRFVAGASGIAGAADLDPSDRMGLIRDLDRFERQSDLILLDCAAGVSRNVMAFLRAADQVLVVTTPEPTAITDAYALIKVLNRDGPVGPIGLVVNQIVRTGEGRVVADRIASVAARFLGVPVDWIGEVHRDDHVVRAVRERVPFVVKYPRAPASACISTLAKRLAEPLRKTSSRAGFFRRMLGVFY